MAAGGKRGGQWGDGLACAELGHCSSGRESWPGGETGDTCTSDRGSGPQWWPSSGERRGSVSSRTRHARTSWSVSLAASLQHARRPRCPLGHHAVGSTSSREVAARSGPPPVSDWDAPLVTLSIAAAFRTRTEARRSIRPLADHPARDRTGERGTGPEHAPPPVSSTTAPGTLAISPPAQSAVSRPPWRISTTVPPRCTHRLTQLVAPTRDALGTKQPTPWHWRPGLPPEKQEG